MAAPSGEFRPDLITESGRPNRFALALPLLVLAGVLSLAAAHPQFTSTVNVVEVYVTVTDAKGLPVGNLSRGDFVVRENGVVQAVSTFAAGEFPLSVALALDRSFSMNGARLAGAKAAARAFLGELRPEDESMVLAIGSTTDVVARLSRQREEQLAAVAALDAFGTTGLFDAILAAIDAVQPAKGRRALVLLSDGSDRYSAATAEQTLARARESDVLVYPIAFGSTRPPMFAELAALTGGRSFHIDDARRLPDTMKTIATELRQQYLLGYSPVRPVRPGSNEWRSIAVAVDRPGVRVRARDGYVVK